MISFRFFRGAIRKSNSCRTRDFSFGREVFYFEKGKRFKQLGGNSLHRFTRDERDRFYRICRRALSPDTLGMKCSSERARLPLRKSDGHAGIIVVRDFICIRFHILFPSRSQFDCGADLDLPRRAFSRCVKRTAAIVIDIFSQHSRRIDRIAHDGI